MPSNPVPGGNKNQMQLSFSRTNLVLLMAGNIPQSNKDAGVNERMQPSSCENEHREARNAASLASHFQTSDFESKLFLCELIHWLHQDRG